MKYLAFEGKKLLFSRYALILLALLFIANGILCFYKYSGAQDELIAEVFDYEAIDRIISDQISDPDGLAAYREKLNEEYKAYQKASMQALMQGITDLEYPKGDYKYTSSGKINVETVLINNVDELLASCNSYPADLESFIEEKELRLDENEEGTFSRAYAEMTIRRYREFQAMGVGIGFERIHGWNDYFDYDLIALFMPAAVVILVAAVMLNDKSIGFYPILSAGKNGRRKTVTAKIGLLLILSVLISILFSLSSFAIIGLRVGYSSPGNAIQAIDEFRYSPYAFTMISYFFVQLGIRTLTLCAFTLFICLVTALLNNHIYAYFAGAAFIGGNFFVYTKTFLTPTNFTKVNNLMELLTVNNQFVRVRAYSFFEEPVLNLPILAAIFASITALSFFFTPLLQAKTGFLVKNPIARLWTFIRRYIMVKPRMRKPKKHSLHLAPYELKKVFYSPVVIFVALALAAGSVYLSYRAYETKPSFNAAAYNGYIDHIVGEPTKESEAYLRKESNRISTVLKKRSSMQADYRDGKITFEEYMAYLDEYAEASMLNPVLSLITQHTSYIKNHERETGQTTWYVHDLGWDRYFDRSFDLCLYALVLFLFWALFQTEFKRNSRGGSFNFIQSTTKNGRHKTFFAKIFTAIGVFTAVLAVCITAELIIFAHYYGLPELNAPLASIETFGGVSADISILAYLILSYVYKYLGFLLLILITASISQFAKRPIPILTGTALLTIFPHLLVKLGMVNLRFIDFILLLDPHSLLRFSAEGYQPAAQGTLTFQVFLVVYTVLGLLCVGAAYCSFVKNRIRKYLRRKDRNVEQQNGKDDQESF